MDSDDTTVPQDTKKVFRKMGTCSRTFCYVLNRGFGCPSEPEERAADPLAGGIMGHGHQCGMLWGSALATGAEAYRRSEDRDQAIGLAITATQHLMASYVNRAKNVDCRDVTGCDLTSKISMAKYLLSGRFLFCFDLAEQWAPEAIRSATEGLALGETGLPHRPMSCASEVARRMGASDAQMVMVAGFGGGLGLSGNACGALGAAIWMKTLAWCRDHPGKSAYTNPDAKRVLEAFRAATGQQMLCHTITGQRFTTIDEHTEFVRNGGCAELIELLARS